jgi:tetratricopeptide (TPR) repeat protein
MSTVSSTNAVVLLKRALSAYNASNFDQAIEHSRAALIMLDGMEDEASLALVDDAFERQALAYQRMGNFASARDLVTEWQHRTQREEGRIKACIQMSRVETYSGNYETSAQLAEKAIQMAQAADYRAGLGTAKRVRADIYWKLGRTEEALAMGQSALMLLEQVSDLEQQAAARVSLAAAYHSCGQFYKAIQHLQRAVRIVEQLGRQFELAIVNSNLGETYAELFAMEKALEAHQKAIELVGYERAHPDLIRNLGVDLMGVGRRDEGQTHLMNALERARRVNDPDLVSQVLYSLAEADLKAGKLDLAEERGNELLANANKADSLRHRIRAWMILGDLARQRGDQAKAQQLFNECSMAAQRSADRNTIWRTHAALHDMLRDTMPKMADIHRRIAAEMMVTILNGIEDPELRQIFRNAESVRSVLGER